MGMVIERATVLEWPQIESLARSYFDRMGRPYQDRGVEVEWFVARAGERVHGCYATQFCDDLNQLWIMDLYRAETYSGARSVSRMIRHAYDRADEKGYAVGFTIDPENYAWWKVVERYSGAECIGMIYLRHPS
jgi:hypothetical protein